MEFERAYARVREFGRAAYDLIASRTGTTFFGDAAAAFANLATAARPGGGLAILVWRSLAVNEWLREIFDCRGSVARRVVGHQLEEERGSAVRKRCWRHEFLTVTGEGMTQSAPAPGHGFP